MSGDSFDQWLGRSENPAAPAGAQQASRAAAGYDAKDPRYTGSKLGKWTSENGLGGTAGSWWNGQNTAGTNNGWDNDFTDKFMSGRDAAMKQGSLATYFEQPKATGVVTYDHQATDGKTDYKFGDVYEDGKKVANLYEQFDKLSADQMMSAWLFDGKQMANIMGSSDREQRLGREVDKAHEKNNTDIPKAYSAMEMSQSVQEREDKIRSGAGDELIVGATALGTAATTAAAGAVLGSVVPGLGTLAGGIGGFAVGGVAGLIGGITNRDELVEQAARAYEVTALTDREEGGAKAFTTGLKEWAGFSTKLTSPVGNLVHGAEEVVKGGVGDKNSEFYAQTDSGKSTTGLGWHILSLGAAVADGALQFTSPFNRTVYMGQMGATVAGGVSEQVALGGQTYNSRSGKLDNIWKKDDGSADPLAGIAGSLAIAIDAVQMAGLGGLARMTKAGRLDAAAGRVPTEAAGFRMIRDDAGNIVGKKATMALLAPSEQIAAISAWRQARVTRMSAVRGTDEAVVYADDFYNAAMKLASGDNRLKQAMVNGFGEGYEEVAQGILEPYSQHGKIDFGELTSAFLYGAAGGIGMSAGATGGAVKADTRMRSLADVSNTISRGRAYTDEEWNAKTPTERRIAAAISPDQAMVTRGALEKMVREQSTQLVASSEDAAKAHDAKRMSVEKELKSGTQNTDSYTVISGILSADHTIRPESNRGSAQKVFYILDERLKGVDQQVTFLQNRLTDLGQREQNDEVASKVAEATELLQMAQAMRLTGAHMVGEIERQLDTLFDTSGGTVTAALSPSQAEALVGAVNSYMEAAFDLRYVKPADMELDPQVAVRAAAQFMSMISSREPKLDAGSYPAILPRIDWELTRQNAGNFVQINNDLLQSINGDFDGDMFRAEFQVILSDRRFSQIRSGATLGGVGKSLDLGTHNFDKAMTEAVGVGLISPKDSILKVSADAVVSKISKELTTRYGSFIPSGDLLAITTEFEKQLAAGIAEARTNLIDALYEAASQQINALGEKTLVNEPLWISNLVRASLQEYQRTYRKNRAEDSAGPTPAEDNTAQRAPKSKNMRKQEASTQAQTLSLFAAGNTLFRQFQKIHYTWYNSKVLQAADTEPSDLLERAKTLELIAKGITRSELHLSQNDISVESHVLAMLDRLVDDALREPELAKVINPANASTILANIKVKDVWIEEGVPVTDDQSISLLQLLLKRALDAEYAEFRQVFAADPKMQSRHDMLRSLTLPNSEGVLNAEKAFMQVFGGRQFIDSLGRTTGNLNANITPEQWIQAYNAEDESGKQLMEQLVKEVDQYLDRADSTNMPYTMAEMSGGGITAYRSMVDAMLAVAHTRFDDQARSSKAAADNYLKNHQYVQAALVDHRELSNRHTPKNKRKANAELIQELFAANPAYGRQILDLIPDAAANGLFEYRVDPVDGQEKLYIDSWLYESFAIENPKEALAFYWRNLTLTKWNSTLARINEADGAFTNGRVYHDLDSRFQRLLMELADEPGQMNLEKLIRKLSTTTDLDAFFEWLNSEPGMRGKRAPLLPFNDDVASFESDEAGGWSVSRPSVELQVALKVTAEAAPLLRDSAKFRLAADAQNTLLIQNIERALHDDPQATDSDREALRNFTNVLATSAIIPRGFAPSSTLDLIRGGIRQFDSGSTDKGKTPTTFEGIGQAQAQLDGFGFLTGVERVMEETTALGIGSLETNIGDLGKKSGLAMSPSGQQIELSVLDIETALGMLKDYRTAPLAFAMLTPTSLEKTDKGVAERLMFDPSMQSLLDGSGFDELFRADENGNYSLDTNARYLSVVDAVARNFGGDFDATRYTASYAIAMTSGLMRQSEAFHEQKFMEDALNDTTSIMRAVGEILSSPDAEKARVLESLRKYAVAGFRERYVGRRLPGFTKADGTLAEAWVTSLKEDLEQQYSNDLAALVNTSSTSTVAAVKRRKKALRAQYDSDIEHLEALLNDDTTASTVQRFHVTEDETLDEDQLAIQDGASRAAIVEYIRGMSNALNRMPGAEDQIIKLNAQLDRGEAPALDPIEWSLLSRSAMGVYLADQTFAVATHVSIAGFEKGDPLESTARFYKYFDTTYSWLATDLLDESSPLAAALTWVDRRADRPIVTPDVLKMRSLLEKTILDRKKLGTWTDGLRHQLTEMHTRIDSSSAPTVIAQSGNIPKRWATIAFGTRRTNRSDGLLDLGTTLTVKGDRFNEATDPFNLVVVQPTGRPTPVQMPLAQLNNRFYSSVKFNGEEIPLSYKNMGYAWDGGDGSITEDSTPLRYIANDRLARALSIWAKDNKVAVKDVDVELTFLHPDSQPAEGWYHNAFFEGMNHTLLNDGAESLIAGIWSDNGGITALLTQWAIDAGKQGQKAARAYRGPGAAQLRTATDKWDVDRDFGAMLHEKARLILESDQGSGRLPIESFNAIYKIMKLQHLVGVTRGAERIVLTAEQVIAAERDAQGNILDENGEAYDSQKLIVLSLDVLRTMLGETGTQGTDRFISDDYRLNPDMTPKFQGITNAMMEAFGDGWFSEAGTIADTSLVNVGQQRVMGVRRQATDKEINSRRELIIRLDKQKATTIAARRSSKLYGKNGQKLKKDYLNALKLAKGMIEAERVMLGFAEINAGMILPKNISDIEHSARIVELIGQDAADLDYRRAWHIRDEGGPNYVGGVLTVESLSEARGADDQIVKDDAAILELHTFQRPELDVNQVEERVQKSLDYLMGTGATIVLASGDARGDVRFDAAVYLMEHGYSSVGHAPHVYAPIESDKWTQNERAYESTLGETQTIRPMKNSVVMLLLDPLGFDENDAALNPASTKLRDRKVVNNILPSSYAANYNLARDDNKDTGAYSRAYAQLLHATDPANDDARAELLAMGGKDPARTMPLEEALDEFHAKIKGRASLVPQVGDVLRPGSIIPFVNAVGKVVLYRHGFKLPNPRELTQLQSTGDLGIALAKSEEDPQATTNSGVLTDMNPEAGHGQALVLETPLQPAGNKIQLVWNGMKYVVINPTKDTRFAKRIFNNGLVADLMTDKISSDKKEAFLNRVNGIRSALTFFEYDFTDDMTQFFFPGQKVTAENRVLTYNMLKALSIQSDYQLPLLAAHQLSRITNKVSELAGEFAQGYAGRVNEFPPDWAARLNSGASANVQIARAVVTYLLTPHADVDNILRSPGFSHPAATTDPNLEVREVPGLFADLLDNGMNSEIHKELIRRFDAQLASEDDGSGITLLNNWTAVQYGPRDADGNRETLRFVFQYGEAQSSGDNPVTDGEAFDINKRGSVSSHNVQATALSLGGITAAGRLKKSEAFGRSFRKGSGVVKFSDATSTDMWAMLADNPTKATTPSGQTRRERLPQTARRALAREEAIGFFHELNREGDDWKTSGAEYLSTATEILNHMNLTGNQIGMVDTWVRQILGSPYGLSSEGEELGVIRAKDAVDAAKSILRSVQKGLVPTTGRFQPLIDVNQWTTIYMANVTRPAKEAWAPVMALEPNAAKASSWDDWVNVAFGTVFDEDRAPRFEPLYLLAVDGFMHGYQNATSSTRDLPVSVDELRDRQLLDPKTEEMMLSVSADENLLASEPSLFNSAQAGLDEILGGQRIYGDHRGAPDASSAIGRHVKYVDSWFAEQDVPRSATKNMRNVRKTGMTFLGHSSKTHPAWGAVMNSRAAMGLINLGLVAMAPVEAFFRRSIDAFSNVAAGESIGAVGKMQSRVYDAIQDKSFGAVVDYFGFDPHYTPKDQELADAVVKALSTRNDFKAMIYKELMYQFPSMPGHGSVTKWLENFAKFGARLQDPAIGLLPKDLARIYVSTLMRNTRNNANGNIYSIETALMSLSRSPSWLEVNDKEVHDLAINSIAQVRSLKTTVLSQAVRGIVTPMSENPSLVWNTAGNALKVMTLFQNFFANAISTMTGMQAAADFAAFMVDGREKKLGKRIQAIVGGSTYEGTDYYDMSEVLESVDLADSFIRGGVTHTALFMFGLAAGGLGLSGEDDEEKRRRRQSELQGADYVRDPRQLQADLANKDSLYLNWLPGSFGDIFKVKDQNGDTNKVMQMNFMSRTFLSPIIGMERFHNTGDFSEVIHGYRDALGSHPLVNEQLWNAASDTAATLNEQAALAAESDDPSIQIKAPGLWMNAVGVMERMLFENAMVNMIYVGTDEFDRDPGKVQKRDSDGNLQVDVNGNPYGTDVTRQFVDKSNVGTVQDGRLVTSSGEVKDGYVKRDVGGTAYRTLSENRFGMALVGSLFSGLTGGGFGGDFFRKNMAVKTRDVELTPNSEGLTESEILMAFLGQGGQQSLTDLEAAAILKKQYRDAGVFYDPAVIEKQSKINAAKSGFGAMSIINDKGREVPTEAGSEALLAGLRDGYVKLGDESMQGQFISYDTRLKIQEKWMKQLVVEGMELGLDQQGATSRMKRLWFGEYGDPESNGISKLVFSKDIPYADTLTYNQLNSTYVTGIDGYPRATGFKRDSVMSALGLNIGNRAISQIDTGLEIDARLNTVDGPAGVNTGMRALQRVGDGFIIPTTEEEIRKAADDIIKALGDITIPQPGYDSTSKGGYSRGGYGGGGGGYSSGGSSYFTRMNNMPQSRVPYGNNIPFINTSNPILRRAGIRRERVWSDRGRLKQWQ